MLPPTSMRPDMDLEGAVTAEYLVTETTLVLKKRIVSGILLPVEHGSRLHDIMCFVSCVIWKRNIMTTDWIQ